MALKIEAKNDYIITEPTEVGETPFAKVETAAKQQYLLVVAVGDEVTACKVGDSVIPYGAEFQSFMFEGKQYVVLQDHQVLGILDV